jgi:phenylalanyl-tRNA synthetase alpha chain
MQSKKPPLRVVCPGKVFRRDDIDATHTPVFHQMEGLVVDPHYFPFTEPSAEIDISCFNCGAVGCSTCKHSGWIEIAGCGMVDPKVFDTLGIDSEKYTGYAFGCGIDRMAMLKYRIPDIRMLFDNDLRFLRQFR